MTSWLVAQLLFLDCEHRHSCSCSHCSGESDWLSSRSFFHCFKL